VVTEFMVRVYVWKQLSVREGTPGTDAYALGLFYTHSGHHRHFNPSNIIDPNSIGEKGGRGA
jgi:hypothetical protein